MSDVRWWIVTDNPYDLTKDEIEAMIRFGLSAYDLHRVGIKLRADRTYDS